MYVWVLEVKAHWCVCVVYSEQYVLEVKVYVSVCGVQ